MRQSCGLTDGGSSEDPRLPLVRRLLSSRLSVQSSHRRASAGLLTDISGAFCLKCGDHREPLRKGGLTFQQHHFVTFLR